MEKTLCELFAGVGGFRLGLERASKEWKTVFFSQWEPGRINQWAHECYVKHWGDINEYTGIDIAKVPKEIIPDHNLLVGGFPCQDYSVAKPLNESHGIYGQKGVLWWQIRDVLAIKKPPFVLLENVDRLLISPSKQRGRDFGIMLSCFNQLDYSVEWRVVNAAEYGAAQRRRRVFIFAYKNTTKYGKNISLYSKEIINNNGFFAKTFPIENNENIQFYRIETDDIYNVSQTFKYHFLNSGYMKNGYIFTAETKPIYIKSIPLRNLLEENPNDKYFITTSFEKFKFLKGKKRIIRTRKDGQQYVFSEGAIPFPDSIDLPARTMLTSESSVNRSTHVIEDPKRHALRLLTPLETERIQGFDDNWTNTGMPENFRYFCMGNALVVPLIEKMGKTLNDIFENE